MTADESSDARVIKSALYVDFDNIFIGLRSIDRAAAQAFATNPARWLGWFERGMPRGDADRMAPRSVLLRRCYLNPGSFSFFRENFTNAAFSVVDCPSLTYTGKNSSDIHMVMDILDTLSRFEHFSEFIILSGDSDFTPVLLRLRACDRRTIILTTAKAPPAYASASDLVLSADVFIREGLGVRWAEKYPNVPPRPLPPVVIKAPEVSTPAEPSSVEVSKGTASEGAGESSTEEAGAPPEADEQDALMADLARRVHEATGVPVLAAPEYALVFRLVERELRREGFHPLHAAREVREACQGRGLTSVSRTNVLHILKIVDGPKVSAMREHRRATADELARVFRKRVGKLCAEKQLKFTAEEEALLDEWLLEGEAEVEDVPPPAPKVSGVAEEIEAKTDFSGIHEGAAETAVVEAPDGAPD